MTALQGSERDRSLEAAVPETEDQAPALQSVGHAGGGARPRARTWLAALVGVLVLPAAVAAGLTFTASGSNDHSSNAAEARVVSADVLESEYGIRVTLVGVTADGGLVDVRFTVLDKDKAAHVLHDAASLPEVYVESSGRVLSAPKPMAHKMTILDGATYFFLYPNSGGAVQRGTPVSIVVGDVRLAPLDAQS